MFSFIIDIFTTCIGVFLPIYQTWKIIRSRKTTQLVPLAKYWSVYGIYTAIEYIARLLYIPYILPGYSLIKFFCIIYIYTSGYEQIFDNILSPFIKKNEPVAVKCIFTTIEMGGKILRDIFTQLVNYTIKNISNLNSQQAISYKETITHHFTEVQDDDDIFFDENDIKPDITCLRNETNNLLTSDSDSDYVEITKQIQRKTNRRRKTRQK